MLKEQLQKQIEQEGKAQREGFESKLLAAVADSEYCIGAEKYASLWQAAEEKAEKYEKALKEIRKWELATGAKIKVKHLDILKDIMETVNKALTPKTSDDE